MPKPKDVFDRRYREVYETLVSQLQERRCNDPTFTVDDIHGFLRDAYIRQGNDWIGHGALFDATQGATIAAYEAVLADWLDELGQAVDKDEDTDSDVSPSEAQAACEG